MDKAAEREFSEFVAARGTTLLRVAYALTGEQHAAEDLVQTALAKAMLRWTRIRGDAEPYVRKIMYHEHVSWWRRLRHRREVVTAEPPERGRADDDPHLRLTMRAALATLPARQRAVLVLRYLEDLSEQQVADLLGVSTGTVGSQASRALATLRRRLPDLDGTGVRR
ncbi:SigE family RNA polymerase sigma factor [Dactylosporangium sp. AC04546]|uniref:SigE family RNA polymerase sigma factor n=1 Tax=Dactylosporangium sp. AC04546 TaxID=2862460 RepID=UPI001EDE0FA9|nr:SigE family RNA polymerase sigma factor [Dactylosporangium sp. AC04546]WVK83157.1 SigE family RNA polymerase sigma factor [Dactylosporangium sp. AC04546]